MKLHIGSFHIGYLYLSEVDNSGTLIIRRLAYRWGCHRWALAQGRRFQWYGRRKWHFFL